MRTQFRSPSTEAYLRYYHQQRGGSLPYFRGDVYGQRGAGFGSIFAKLLGGIRGLISRTPEWVKTGASELAKQAVKTGMEVAGDAARAKSKDEWRSAAKKSLKRGTGNLLSNIGSRIQQGKGRKTIKRRRPMKQLRQRKKQLGKGIKRQSIGMTRKPVGKRRRRRNKRQTTKQRRTKLDFLGN